HERLTFPLTDPRSIVEWGSSPTSPVTGSGTPTVNMTLAQAGVCGSPVATGTLKTSGSSSPIGHAAANPCPQPAVTTILSNLTLAVSLGGGEALTNKTLTGMRSPTAPDAGHTGTTST